MCLKNMIVSRHNSKSFYSLYKSYLSKQCKIYMHRHLYQPVKIKRCTLPSWLSERNSFLFIPYFNMYLYTFSHYVHYVICHCDFRYFSGVFARWSVLSTSKLHGHAWISTAVIKFVQWTRERERLVKRNSSRSRQVFVKMHGSIQTSRMQLSLLKSYVEIYSLFSYYDQSFCVVDILLASYLRSIFLAK